MSHEVTPPHSPDSKPQRPFDPQLYFQRQESIRMPQLVLIGQLENAGVMQELRLAMRDWSSDQVFPMSPSSDGTWDPSVKIYFYREQLGPTPEVFVQYGTDGVLSIRGSEETFRGELSRDDRMKRFKALQAASENPQIRTVDRVVTPIPEGIEDWTVHIEDYHRAGIDGFATRHPMQAT